MSETPRIKIGSKLKERLLCPFGSPASSLTSSVSGCLYGFPPCLDPELSSSFSHYSLVTCTGKQKTEEERLNEEDGQRRDDLEVLNEIIPCGIDPVGVFILETREDKERNNGEKNHREVHRLLGALPEAFLEAVDPVVVFGGEDDDNALEAFVIREGELVAVQQLEEVDSEELLKSEAVALRVRGTLNLTSGQNENDLHIAFKHLIEKVSCPYGSFRLCHSDVFFLHVMHFGRKGGNGAGWASEDLAAVEDEEECRVTNIDEDTRFVGDLWRYVREADEEKEDEDDGFGPVVSPKEKARAARNKSKAPAKEKDVMDFRLMMKMSGNACTSKTVNCAPVINFENRSGQVVRIPLKVDAIGYARRSARVVELMEVLKGSVQRQLHEFGRSVLSELKMKSSTSQPEAFHVRPAPLGRMACTMIYNRRGKCHNFAEYRKHIHGLFLLAADRPLFRRVNAVAFEADSAAASSQRGPLANVHVGLKNASATEGVVRLVQGTYSYHHYMQDGFNDDGWGCAYRSLQTIISWFRHQGYTESAIPSHAQIQKCLVEMGDKEKGFVNSKQWIGSSEVGYVLEATCGEVQSRFISVSSGEELASKGRELEHHFRVHGTPVMIGGGVLAHTILGVDWNESSGETRWLILDPHYTGADWTNTKGACAAPNVAHMQQKGWVGWKGTDFWKKDAFYNMCMPQRPTNVC